jgi:hypothetical protein
LKTGQLNTKILIPLDLAEARTSLEWLSAKGYDSIANKKEKCQGNLPPKMRGDLRAAAAKENA